MATYSYILCSKCVGTGKAAGGPCPQCQGARMVGALVKDDPYVMLETAARVRMLEGVNIESLLQRLTE